MKSGKKKFTIVGNWKMNPDTLDEAREIFSHAVKTAKKYGKVSVLVAPPAPFLGSLSLKKQTYVSLGIQDVDQRPRGSFTGSLSALQAKSAGAGFAIIGHSERRAAGDSDTIVREKALRAIEAGLSVVLCVGEKERDEHANFLRIIHDQILSVTAAIDKKKVSAITVAYEPVWAIGKSFDTALSSQAIHEMSIYIKKVMAEVIGTEGARKIKVLYGGSVNFENAKPILSNGAIDGLLIGRQSLDKEAFSNIIGYAHEL